jgi:hypothetical protein
MSEPTAKTGCPARLTWSGRFHDAGTERAFRDAQFRDDYPLARVLILCVLAMDAVFLPFDYAVAPDGPRYAWVFGLRLTACLVSLAAWVALGRVGTSGGVRAVLFAWFSPALALNLAPLFVGGSGHLSSAAPYAVAIVLIYFLPVPFAFRLANGLFVTAAHLGAVTVEGWPSDGAATLVDVIVGFAAANAVGVFVSRGLNLARRRQYAAGVDLERATKEIRTLEGLLPICAHCKKIRDEAGQWQGVEEYVQGHSRASFTHGICPSCLKTEYGLDTEVTPR